MKVIIRPANQKDIKAMSEINKMSLPETYDASFWEEHLVKGKSRFSYVAEMSKLMIGYIFANEECVISFAVHPKFRDRGLGKILMWNYLFDVCKDVFLHVETDNFSAKKLYEFMGFQTRELLQNYYNSRNKDAYLMVRPFLQEEQKSMPSPPKKLKIPKQSHRERKNLNLHKEEKSQT